MLTRCSYFTGCKCENRVCIVREIEPGPRVEGEDSTTEPATHMQTRHLPVSDVTWRAIRVSVRMTGQLRR